jgi:lambda family phage portal protein
MGILARIRSAFRAPPPARVRPLAARAVIRGRYDAAVTNDENRRHWANADYLSAEAANSPDVRRILRARARYEAANNTYAAGIILTLGNDTIGTGPTLQMLTPDAAANKIVEEQFEQWTEAVRLAEKLRTMRMARTRDGEAFCILAANPKLDSPIKLDLRLIEADQVADPDLAGARGENADDGIVFDGFGNPVEYHVLREHPGSYSLEARRYDTVPAEAMIHDFRVDRPGQTRGVPEITPALPLFAQLRRYTLAVIAAAETAADFAAVLYTENPQDDSGDDPEPMDLVELERRMATVLPRGYRLGQVQAMQPATTYAEFKREILNEIARCLNMPYNVAAGNSAGYNYASGRLDHQTYYKAIGVDQFLLGGVVLDRILRAWLAEAILVSDLLPLWMRTTPFRAMDHQWFWDGREHVDPSKEATAQATRLGSHTTTLAYEYARQGRDWETELRQRANEVKLIRQLGLDAAQAAAADDPDVDEETADADAEKAAA